MAVAAIVKAGMGDEIPNLAGTTVAQGRGSGRSRKPTVRGSQSLETHTQGNMWEKPIWWKVRARSHLKDNLTMVPFGS